MYLHTNRLDLKIMVIRFTSDTQYFTELIQVLSRRLNGKYSSLYRVLFLGANLIALSVLQPLAYFFSPSELQVLMGSLLYMKQGIADSPYAHLLDPIHWADICDIFTRDACALLGLSVESPLSVV